MKASDFKTQDEMEKMKVAEIKAHVRAYNEHFAIRGYSKLNKSQLISEVLTAQMRIRNAGKPAPKPAVMPPKKQSDSIDFEALKEDSLRKQLKLKKDEKFKIGELQKANKTEIGEQFQFHDKTFKMTPLLKKRITLAITLIRASKPN